MQFVTGGCLQFPVSSTTQDGGSERQVFLAQSGSRHNCPQSLVLLRGAASGIEILAFRIKRVVSL